MIYDTWKTTKFGQIEVLRQQVRRNLLILLFEGLVVALKENFFQEAELERLEREEALKAAEDAAKDAVERGSPLPTDLLLPETAQDDNRLAVDQSAAVTGGSNIDYGDGQLDSMG